MTSPSQNFIPVVMPPSTPPKPTLSPEAQAILDQAGVGAWYSNPLQSMTVRWVVGAALGLLFSKVFKFEVSEIQLQDYVELVLGLVAFAFIAYSRWRATKQIVSVKEAADMILPGLQGSTTRVKDDVLTQLKVTHPKVHDIVATVLEQKPN